MNGRATALAVDPSGNRLYVAEANRISAYNPDGTLGENEVQRVYPFQARGGYFRLSFMGRRTGPIPFDASNAELEAALARLPSIGRGNVVVKMGPNGRCDHLIAFTGALAKTKLPLLVADVSTLRIRSSKDLIVEEITPGFSGQVVKGLHDVSGLAAYTYAGLTHYLFAAESSGRGGGRVDVFAGGDIRTLRLRATIDGAQTPAGRIGFGPTGAKLAVDGKDGHLYLYDVRHAAIDEFEATGPYVSHITGSSFGQAEPGGIAIDRARGGKGTVYVANGALSVPAILAFGPRRHARRKPLSSASLGSQSGESCGIAIDTHGDVYISAGTTIEIRRPGGEELTKIADPNRPCDLAVDSEGDIFAATAGRSSEEEAAVVVYRPTSYPPTASTRYGEPKTIFHSRHTPDWVAVDPANDHLFTDASEHSIAEFAAARDDSRLLDRHIGEGLLTSDEAFSGGLGVCAATGEIFAAGRWGLGWNIYVIDPVHNELVTTIGGSGSRRGPFRNHSLNLAVDQRDCQVFMIDYGRAVEEYEQSGAFITEFGPEVQSLDVATAPSPSTDHSPEVVVLSEDSWLGFGQLSSVP